MLCEKCHKEIDPRITMYGMGGYNYHPECYQKIEVKSENSDNLQQIVEKSEDEIKLPPPLPSINEHLHRLIGDTRNLLDLLHHMQKVDNRKTQEFYWNESTRFLLSMQANITLISNEFNK